MRPSQISVAAANYVAEYTGRRHFAPLRIVFFAALHIGALAAIWYTSWSAVFVAIALHALAGGLGICVGYHRMLTHRAFKAPRLIDYALTTLGTLSLQGGPTEWVALHRQHHQFSDQDGDPHSPNQGFWWSHMGWILWLPTRETWDKLLNRYAPDMIKDRYYVWLENWHVLLSVGLGFGLYAMGGWSWVFWGMFVRLVLTYHHTWLVNSAAHTFGYKNFKISDHSTNNWWVALVSYGEGWHNNHHAFPSSAKQGLRGWELDPSYWFIRTLKAVGLAKDLVLPPAERIQALRNKQRGVALAVRAATENFAQAASDNLAAAKENIAHAKENLAAATESMAENLGRRTVSE